MRGQVAKNWSGAQKVANPIVWEILQPALKLASQLLTNASSWPWWDALFNGTYEPVERGRVPPDKADMTLLRFRARHMRLHDPRQLQWQILEIGDDIMFGFCSGYTNTYNQLPREGRRDKYVYGTMEPKIYEDYTKVWISVEILQPLLRTDLKESER